MNRKIIIGLVSFIAWVGNSQAQQQHRDSVVINVGQASRVIFSIHPSDLPTLKYYDFQALMNDLIKKIEDKDTTKLATPPSTYALENSAQEEAAQSSFTWPEDPDDKKDNYVDRSEEGDDHKRRGKRTRHSINFDIGTNNFLTNGQFPDSNNDLFTVKPFGSWYVGINSTQRTQVGGKFFIEWALGVSWYNFKFQNEQTILTNDGNAAVFTTDPRDLDFQKSKLTVSYLNASVVPMIDFGGNRRKPMLFDGHKSHAFRFGAGPYVGYRIDSYTKQVFKENGDKEKDRNHDSFFLNNVRYGARVQFGFEDVDFFFTYDFNDLFSKGRGPELNAFSFGITF